MARTKIYDKNTKSWVYADKVFGKIPQLKPEFADSIEKCTDTSKLYVLPDGYIYAYMLGGGYTNLVPTATDADGAIYTGKGYQDGQGLNYRVAGAALQEAADHTTTGFIPVVHTDVIRMSGVTWDKSVNTCIIAFYDENKKPLGSYTAKGYVQHAQAADTTEGVDVRCLKDKENQSVTIEDDVATFNIAFNDHNSYTNFIRSGTYVKYVRITAKGSGADMIVTVNEEIAGAEAAGYGWRNTGHAFVPADYEDRIIALEKSQGAHSGVAAEIIPSATESELSSLYEKGVRIVVENPKDNLVPFAIAQNGTVFNGCGYRKEYRLTNTGGVEALDDAVLTGFIPYAHGKIIEITGGLHKGDDYGNYMAFYNSAFEPISTLNVRQWVRDSGGMELSDKNNVKAFTVKTANLPAIANAAYFRISLRPCVGRNMQVRYI